MTTNIRYIGLDVHKETIVIAIADAAKPRLGKRSPTTYPG